jgi:RNA polymerase sigma-70 factor (ECF subfamily)
MYFCNWFADMSKWRGCAMLRNAVFRRIEQQRREAHHLSQLTTEQTSTMDNFFADDLETAVGALPPEQREVIAFKIDGGLTFAQIADIMNISPNTAASRYRYALEKLRQALE